MKRLLLSLLVFPLLHVTPARAAATDLTAQLDALVAPHFPASQPGAVVLVKKDDRILLRKAYGLADLELAVPMRPELIFELGSVTKQLTAAAVMILVDEGKLSLKDDVRKYVPGYPSHGPTITIQQLLTHTSGIPGYTEQPAFAARGRQDLSHEELLAIFKDLPLLFPPGSKWSYSNSNYYLLGMVIEKISGKSYAQFMEENIFKPVGMSHTHYGDRQRILVGRVTGYDRAGDQLSNAEPISMKLPFAAGALVSTVDDLAAWDSAISAGKLLKKPSWARVFTAEKLSDGTSAHYGFGWGISEWQGHRVVSHGGGIPGFNTNITRLPDDHVVVVILCNSLPAPTGLDNLGLALAGLTVGKPLVEPKAAAVDRATLDRYAGVYKVDETQRVLVRRDGDHLTLQRSGGALLVLTPESSTKFFVKETPLRALFVSDGAGKVSGLDVTQPDGSVAHRARTAEPLPPALTAMTVDAKTLEGYVGAYELAPGFVLTVTREEARLFAQATGQPRFELFARAPHEFFLKVVDAQLSFHVTATGTADSVVLHQGGRDLPGKRLP